MNNKNPVSVNGYTNTTCSVDTNAEISQQEQGLYNWIGWDGIFFLGATYTDSFARTYETGVGAFRQNGNALTRIRIFLRFAWRLHYGV